MQTQAFYVIGGAVKQEGDLMVSALQIGALINKTVSTLLAF